MRTKRKTVSQANQRKIPGNSQKWDIKNLRKIQNEGCRVKTAVPPALFEAFFESE